MFVATRPDSSVQRHMVELWGYGSAFEPSISTLSVYVYTRIRTPKKKHKKHRRPSETENNRNITCVPMSISLLVRNTIVCLK